MLDTYTLTVPAFGGDGKAIVGAIVTAVLTIPDYTTDGAILSRTVAAVAGPDGIAYLELVSNLVGTQDSRYKITIRDAKGEALAAPTIQMPESNTSLSQLVDVLPITTEYSTAAALSAGIATAKAAQTTANAEQTADDRVATGEDRAEVSENKEIVVAAQAEVAASADRINTLYWLGV